VIESARCSQMKMTAKDGRHVSTEDLRGNFPQDQLVLAWSKSWSVWPVEVVSNLGGWFWTLAKLRGVRAAGSRQRRVASPTGFRV